MKKKIIIVTIIILITIIFLGIKNSDNYIIKKSYKIFGNSYCPKTGFFYEDDEHFMMGVDAITQYRCKICNKKDWSSTTATPIICDKCADITNRCMQCGRLEK